MLRLWDDLARGHHGGGRAAGKLTRVAIRWALEAVVCQHLPVTRVAESLDVSWHAANDAVLVEGRRVLIDNPAGSTG